MFDKLKLLLWVFVACYTLVVTPAYSQSSCWLKPTVLTKNEQLSYQLYYNLGFIWINAGSCELKIKKSTWNQQGVWQLSAIGQTDPSFNSFFRVNDTLITYVDSSTMIPFKSYKYTHEDTWNGIDIFTFRPSEQGWRVTTQLKRKGKWLPTQQEEILNCGFDILTSIYRLRCLEGIEDFPVGKKFEIPIRLDDGEYTVFMTFIGKERVKLHKSGVYKAYAFNLSLVAGKVFKRGDLLKMWISDDGNNIPLMIESPIRVGKVKAIFKRGLNTRFPVAKPISKE